MFSSYIIYILSKLSTYFNHAFFMYNSSSYTWQKYQFIQNIRQKSEYESWTHKGNKLLNQSSLLTVFVCWRWNQASTDLSRWMHKSHIWNTFRRIVTTLHWELAARRQGTRSMNGVPPSVPRTAWELDSTVYTSCITYPRGRAKRIRIVFALGQWAKIYWLTGKLDIPL